MKTMMTVAVAACALPLFAKIELGTPFSDGVVLQRGREVPVWGKADPGKKVTVEFAGNEASAIAGKCGCWKVMLPSMEASKEDRVMRVTEIEDGWFGSVTDEVEIKDVLVGEVWMCAGQSNTDCPIWNSSTRYRDGWGAMTLTSVNKPFVRLVKTPSVASVKPRYGYKVQWTKMTPAMYDDFLKGTRMPSAMGYYYALELANALDIPIGLVDSSWGGTNIDAWTPPSGYEKVPELADVRDMPRISEAEFEIAHSNGVYRGKRIYGKWIQQPSMLWNGMVAAYAPMACRGFIWYQGCHNASEYQRYCSKMHALYNGWAAEFKNPELKLYFVQLTPWGNAIIPNIQMAQAQFDAEEPNAGMAVINDVGNLTDIHPNDKRTVAKRLSLHALKRDYGWDSVRDNSPTLKSWKIDNGKFVLSFNDAEGWYVYNYEKGNPSVGFELAGTNGIWKAAKLVNVKMITNRHTKKPEFSGLVQGKELIVASDEVKEPVQLRYLHSSPWFGSIYSDRCLPLGAFAIEKK